jgi:vanillate O-demethylase ferredoxin subunit
VIDVVVARAQQEARDICSLKLVAVDDAPLPPFSAGAHIDVCTPSKAVRQYSLCNGPDDTDGYLIAVLREAAGRGGSASMHEVQTGQRLSISEPRNNFPLAHHARRSLLLAGGIGITPLLSMAERLFNAGSDFAMHYCVRSLDRMAFHDRLSTAYYADRVSFHLDDGPVEQAFRLDEVLRNAAADTHLYVCGPGGFMNHVLGTTRAAGWAEDRLHWEFFAGAAANAEGAGAFRVMIASSGKIIEVGTDQSVIAALHARGIVIPTSCEQGVCGTCITGVLEGVPDHRDLFLSAVERAANDQFLPCCSRAKSQLLVLDL